MVIINSEKEKIADFIDNIGVFGGITTITEKEKRSLHRKIKSMQEIEEDI